MKKYPKIECVVCGKPFWPRIHNATTCGTECRAEMEAMRTKEYSVRQAIVDAMAAKDAVSFEAKIAVLRELLR